MHLPHSKTIETYTEELAGVEDELKKATSGVVNNALLHDVQNRLDTLAAKYQHSEEIGEARYKLYELQAFLHYFNGSDERALDFINHAIQLRGENYARAQKLKTQLLGRATTSAQSRLAKKNLVGLEGWLALVVVGIALGILAGIINLLGYPSVFNDLAQASYESAAYVNAATPFLWFEIAINVAFIGVEVWLLVLLAKHKRLAKNVAIAYLAANVLFLIFDYAWATSIFNAFDVAQYIESDIQGMFNDIAGAILGAAIWIPYFLVSKRVKATLTK